MAQVPPINDPSTGTKPVVNTYRSGGKFYDVPLSDDALFRANMPKAEKVYSFTNDKDTFDVPEQDVSLFLKNMPKVKPLHNYDLSFLTATPPPAPPAAPNRGDDFEQTLDLIRATESRGQNIQNQAGTSRAWGHYQIVPDTFELIKQKNPELSYETWETFQEDTDLQRKVAGLLLKDVDRMLSDKGIPLTKENRYYMWFSGNPNLAIADGTKDISTVLTPAQIKANGLEGMSVDEVRGMLAGNLKKGESFLRGKQEPKPVVPVLPASAPKAQETVKEQPPLGKLDQLKVDYFKKTRGDAYANKKAEEIRKEDIAIPGWDQKGVWDKFATGTKAGWEGTKGGLKYSWGTMMEGVDRMDGESDWDYDNRVMKDAKKNFAAVPRGKGVWYQLGSFTPQMVGIAGAALSAPLTAGTSLSAVPTILGGTSIGLIVASSAGGGMNDYDTYMKSTGQKPSYWGRIGVGIGAGGAEYVAERIGISRYLPEGVFSKAFTKFLSTEGKEVAEQLGKSAVKTNPTLAGLLRKTAKNMMEEGSEESLTEAGNLFIESIYKNPQDRPDFEEWISRIKQSFGGGALMGGVLTPLTYRAGIAYENKVDRLNAEAAAALPKGFTLSEEEITQHHATVNRVIKKLEEIRDQANGEGNSNMAAALQGDIDLIKTDPLSYFKFEYEEYKSSVEKDPKNEHSKSALAFFERLMLGQEYIQNMGNTASLADPRSLIETQARQRASELVNPDDGLITIVTEKSTDENIPAREWYVKKGHPTNQDGSMMVWDGNKDGESKFLTRKQMGKKPVDLTPEQYVKRVMTLFDQQEQQRQMAEQNQIEYKGKVYTKSPKGFEDEESETWVDANDNPVNIPKKYIQEWRNQQQKGNVTANEGVKTRVFGKQEYYGSMDERGSFVISGPMRQGEVSSLAENVKQETGDLSSVVRTPVEGQDPTQPMFTVKVVPTDKLTAEEKANVQQWDPEAEAKRKEEEEKAKQPYYKFMGEEVTREEAEAVINLAGKNKDKEAGKKELADLEYRNDPKLDKLIEHHFPKPKPGYSKGKEKLTDIEAKIRIKQAKTIEELKEIKVENDPEMQQLWDKVAKSFYPNTVDFSDTEAKKDTETKPQSLEDQTDIQTDNKESSQKTQDDEKLSTQPEVPEVRRDGKQAEASPKESQAQGQGQKQSEKKVTPRNSRSLKDNVGRSVVYRKKRGVLTLDEEGFYLVETKDKVYEISKSGDDTLDEHGIHWVSGKKRDESTERDTWEFNQQARRWDDEETIDDELESYGVDAVEINAIDNILGIGIPESVQNILLNGITERTTEDDILDALVWADDAIDRIIKAYPNSEYAYAHFESLDEFINILSHEQGKRTEKPAETQSNGPEEAERAEEEEEVATPEEEDDGIPTFDEWFSQVKFFTKGEFLYELPYGVFGSDKRGTKDNVEYFKKRYEQYFGVKADPEEQGQDGLKEEIPVKTQQAEQPVPRAIQYKIDNINRWIEKYNNGEIEDLVKNDPIIKYNNNNRYYIREFEEAIGFKLTPAETKKEQETLIKALKEHREKQGNIPVPPIGPKRNETPIKEQAEDHKAQPDLDITQIYGEVKAKYNGKENGGGKAWKEENEQRRKILGFPEGLDSYIDNKGKSTWLKEHRLDIHPGKEEGESANYIITLESPTGLWQGGYHLHLKHSTGGDPGGFIKEPWFATKDQALKNGLEKFINRLTKVEEYQNRNEKKVIDKLIATARGFLDAAESRIDHAAHQELNEQNFPHMFHNGKLLGEKLEGEELQEQNEELERIAREYEAFGHKADIMRVLISKGERVNLDFQNQLLEERRQAHRIKVEGEGKPFTPEEYTEDQLKLVVGESFKIEGIENYIPQEIIAPVVKANNKVIKYLAAHGLKVRDAASFPDGSQERTLYKSFTEGYVARAASQNYKVQNGHKDAKPDSLKETIQLIWDNINQVEELLPDTATPLEKEMQKGKDQVQAKNYLTDQDYKVVKKGTEKIWGKYPPQGDLVFVSLEAEKLDSQETVYKNISLDPLYPMEDTWGGQSEKKEEANHVLAQRLRNEVERKISNRNKIPSEPKEVETPVIDQNDLYTDGNWAVVIKDGTKYPEGAIIEVRERRWKKGEMQWSGGVKTTTWELGVADKYTRNGWRVDPVTFERTNTNEGQYLTMIPKNEQVLSYRIVRTPGELPQQPTEPKQLDPPIQPTLSADELRLKELTERMRKLLPPSDQVSEPEAQYGNSPNTELLALGTEMAFLHIKMGKTAFADFARAMVTDLGPAVKPYLKSFYNGARDFPGMEEYEPRMDEWNDVRKMDIEQVLSLDAAEKFSVEASWKSFIDSLSKSENLVTLIDGNDKQTALDLLKIYLEDYAQNHSNVFVTQYNEIFLGTYTNQLYTRLVAHGLKTRRGFLIPAEKTPEQSITQNQAPNLPPSPDNILGQLDALHPEEAPLNVTPNTGLEIVSISDKAFVVKGNTRPQAERFREAGGIWKKDHVGWMFPKSRQSEIEQLFGITPKADGQYPENKKAYVTSIIAKLTKGEKIINTPALTSLATQAGLKAGTDYKDIKELYDLASSALNQHILSLGTLNPNGVAADKVGMILDYLDNISDLLPTETQRSSEQVTLQQYSTPLSLAYLVNWVAQPGKGETVLEPSSGEGNLAIFARLSGANVIANEIDDKRLGLLKLLGLRTTKVDGKHVHLMPALKNDKVHTIVMNPPFSRDIALGGQLDIHAAEKHIESSLQKLEPGGRLVAIVGRGMSLDSPTHSAWWNKIGTQYTVMANVAISGDAYRRKGTSFDNRFVVIDKRGATVDEPITGSVENYTQLLDILQTIEPKQRITLLNENTNTSSQGQADPANGGLPATRNSQPNDGSSSGGTSEGTGNVTPGRHHPVAPSSQRPGSPQLPANRGGRGGSGRSSSGSKSSTSKNTPTSRRGSFTGGLVGRNAGEPVTGGFEAPKAVEVEYHERTIELSDNLGYENYTPEIKVKGSQAHPTQLVESTAMSSVPLPKVNYKPILSPTVIRSGALSEAQVEDVILAGAAHERKLPSGIRRGFFLGGGTGYGKGRTVAAIIQDNFNRGRKKAIWISANNKAHYDSVDYWKAVGGDPNMIFKQKDGKSKITRSEGLLMTTYGTLKTNFDPRSRSLEPENFWSTPHDSRLQQFAQWLGKDFDGVIVFDESHNMANAQDQRGDRGKKPASQKALAGIELQKLLPNARIVYASATGATEIRNLVYAQRLGLWGDGTSFNDQQKFITDMTIAGVAGMEIIAKDLKAMGLYTAKQISFEGVQYQTLEHKLTAEQRKLYNQIADSWQLVYANVEQAIDRNLTNKNARRNAKSAFWGAQQRFFSQVIMTLQLPSVIREMQEDLDNDRSCIIQLISTNEALTDRALAEAKSKLADGEEVDYDDLDLSPKSILLDFLKTSYPVHQFQEVRDAAGNTSMAVVRDENGNPVENPESVAERDALIAQLSRDLALPESPLDILIGAFGVDNVAEITGRTKRIVQRPNDEGVMVKVEEKRTESHNEQDKNAFMDGKKRILIFSKAGGTGASFHADVTRANQQQRSHYVLQVGWRADDAIQGFGRSHRSNQRIAPIFKLVTTDLKSQRRFLSSVARRLDQLGALTKGQRQAGGQGILDGSYNLEGRFAEQALFKFYIGVEEGKYPDIEMRELQRQMAAEIIREDETGYRSYNEYVVMDTKLFLNRIMSLRVELMDAVFEGYMGCLQTEVERAKANDTYDEGIQIVKAHSTKLVDQKVINIDPETGGKSYLAKFELEVPNDKWTWNQLQFRVANSGGKFLGYYEEPNSERIYAMFEYSEVGADAKMKKNIVRQSVVAEAPVTREDLKAKYKKIGNKDIAERYWQRDFENYPNTRTKTDYIIKGLILPIWNRLPGYINVKRYVDDNGVPHLGRFFRNRDIDDILSKFNVTNKRTYSMDQVMSALEDGATVRLANDFQFTKTKYEGLPVLKIGGIVSSYTEEDRMKRSGAIYAVTSSMSMSGFYYLPMETAEEGLKKIMTIYNVPVTIIKDSEGNIIETNQGGNIAEDPQAGYNSSAANLQTQWPTDKDFQRHPEVEAQEKNGYVAQDDTGEFTVAERLLTEQKHLTFMGDKLTGPARIKSSGDVAFLFRNLESAATENVFVVFTDKNEDYKVLYLSTGSTSASVIDYKLVARAARDFNAVTMTMVHNHPSGNVQASDGDKGIFRRMEKLATTLGIEQMPSVIINLDSGKYNEFDTFGQDIQDKEPRSQDEPLQEAKVYQFDRMKLYSPSTERVKISNAREIAEFLSKQKRGIGNKIQAMIMDRNLQINRYVLLDGNRDWKDLSKELIYEVGKYGDSVILAANFQIPMIKYIKAQLDRVDAYLLDVLEIKQDQDIVNNYLSLNEQGLMEPVAVYHGSPYEVEKFSTQKVGSGEGTQHFGWGLYFSSREDIAKAYAKGLANKVKLPWWAKVVGKSNKHVYKVKINDRDFMDWDEPITPSQVHYIASAVSLNSKGKISFTEAHWALHNKNLSLYTPIPLNGMQVYEKLEKSLGSAKNASRFLLKAGIAGIRYPAFYTTNKSNKDFNYVVFDDRNIKITGHYTLEPQAPYGKPKVDEAGFYSTVEMALAKIRQDKALVSQWKAMLLNNGAKQAEMDWMGWDELVAIGDNQSYTREEILGWINQNRIEIKETLYQEPEHDNRVHWEFGNTSKFFFEIGDNPDPKNTLEARLVDGYRGPSEVEGFINGEYVFKKFKSQAEAETWCEDQLTKLADKNSETGTKYSQYATPGGKRYKEMLLSLPDQDSFDNEYEIVQSPTGGHILKDKNGETVLTTNIKNRQVAEDEFRNTLKIKKQAFGSSHWEERNVLVHVRFDERTTPDGSRVLFLEELQSDWAQKGKKEGFMYSVPPGYKVVKTKYGYGLESEDGTVAWGRDDWESPEKAIENFITYIKPANQVPQMPFKKTDQWVNLVFRRMMRYAAQNGFDRIAWTSGAMQAGRYDLSKQVDSITTRKIEDGYYTVQGDKDGRPTFDKSWVKESELEGLLGKDLSEKIIDYHTNVSEDWKSFSGVDLQVGGQGMIAFYDHIMPSAISKLGKPFGARVEPLTIGFEATLDSEKGDEFVEWPVTNIEQAADILDSGYQIYTRDGFGEYAELTEMEEINDYLNDGETVVAVRPKTPEEIMIFKNQAMIVQSFPITPQMRLLFEEGMPLFEPESFYGKKEESPVLEMEQEDEDMQDQDLTAVPTKGIKGEAFRLYERLVKEHYPVDGEVDVREFNYWWNKLTTRQSNPMYTKRPLKDTPGAESNWNERKYPVSKKNVEPITLAILNKLARRLTYDRMVERGETNTNPYRITGHEEKSNTYQNEKALRSRASEDPGTYTPADDLRGQGNTDTGSDHVNPPLLTDLFAKAQQLIAEKHMVNEVIGEYGARRLDEDEKKGNLVNKLFGDRGYNLLKTANVRTKNLEVARKMEQAGKPKEEIRLATLWERGADGMWRYEIVDDIHFTDKFNKLNTGIFTSEEITLAEAISFPELFRAYPELSNVKISRKSPFFDLWQGTQGWFNEAGNEIVVTPYAKDPLGTIVHEIQHWIQQKEGFARGGNPSSAFEAMPEDQLKAVLEGIKAKLNERIQERQQEIAEYEAFKASILPEQLAQLAELSKQYMDLKHESDRMYDEHKAKFGKDKNPYTDNEELKENRKKEDVVWAEGKKILSTILGKKPSIELNVEVMFSGGNIDKGLKEKRKELISDRFDLAVINSGTNRKELIKLAQKEGGDYAFESYQRLAGEVEARNATNRIPMSLEHRRKFTLEETEDKAREDQIITFDSPQSNMSVIPPLPLTDHLHNVMVRLMPSKREKRTLSQIWEGMREAYQDNELPVRRLEEEVAKRGGEIGDNRQPYRKLNLSKGRLETLHVNYVREKMEPIMEVISEIGYTGMPRELILPYIICKHAPERNTYMRKRDYEKWFKKHENDYEKWFAAHPDSTHEEQGEFFQKYQEMLDDKWDSMQQKDYSGIMPMDIGLEFTGDPDGFATTISTEFENALPQELIDRLWDRIRAANMQTIDFWEKGRQISADEAEEYRNRYEYFVPLRGWRDAKDADSLAYIKGQGFSKSLQYAKGRKSLADNPLAYIQSVTFKAINEMVDFEIKQEFYRLVSTNYQGFEDLYRIRKAYYIREVNPLTGEETWELSVDPVSNEMAIPDQELFDSGDATTIMYKSSMNYQEPRKERQKEVLIHRDKKEGGDAVVVMMEDWLTVAQALNHRNRMYHSIFSKELQDAKKWDNEAINTIAWASNAWKANMTARNVVFATTNFVRDIQEAPITALIRGEKPGKLTGNVFASFPAAFRGITGNLNLNNERDRMYDEFSKVGGITGYSHLKTIEEIEADLAKRLKRLGRKHTRSGRMLNGLAGTIHALEVWSNMFETATRLGVYTNARKMGKTQSEAGMLAKEYTLNFNRGGKLKKLIDAFFPFAPVGIESLHKNTSLFKHYPKAASSVAGSIVILGILEAMMNDLTEPETEDGEYYNLNEYVRQNYWIIPDLYHIFTKGKKGDKYLRIHIPQFWRGFKSLGTIIYDVAKGKSTVGHGVGRAITNFLWGSLSPIDLGGLYVNGKVNISVIAPTIARPFAELAVNRNYMGYQIAKEPFTRSQEKAIANSHLHTRDVNPFIKFLTDALYRAGGGDNETRYYVEKNKLGQVERKKVSVLNDVNPSHMEHLLTGYFGGTAKIGVDFISTLVQWFSPDEEIDFKNVPFVNAFLRKTPTHGMKVMSEYYDLKDEIDGNDLLQQAYYQQRDFDKYLMISADAYINEYTALIRGKDQALTNLMKAMDFQNAEGSEEVINLMEQTIEQIKALKEKYQRK